MGSQEAFRRRVRRFQDRKAEQLEKRYRGVFYKEGQEIDIPPHRSAFSSRGECHGRGIIGQTSFRALSMFKLESYIDRVLIGLLRQGRGMCSSCGAEFTWTHNYATKKPDATIDPR